MLLTSFSAADEGFLFQDSEEAKLKQTIHTNSRNETNRDKGERGKDNMHSREREREMR